MPDHLRVAGPAGRISGPAGSASGCTFRRLCSDSTSKQGRDYVRVDTSGTYVANLSGIGYPAAQWVERPGQGTPPSRPHKAFRPCRDCSQGSAQTCIMTCPPLRPRGGQYTSFPPSEADQKGVLIFPSQKQPPRGDVRRIGPDRGSKQHLAQHPLRGPARRSSARRRVTAAAGPARLASARLATSRTFA